MRFENYLNEKWKRRQLRKGKPFWVYDKYEIQKADGEFIVSDITQKGDTPNSYKKLGSYDSLKKAQDSIGD